MIHILQPFLEDLAYKALPQYQLFIKMQSNYVHSKYDILQGAAGFESPGVRLLRFILSFVDYDYLDTKSNHYERYIDYLQYIREDMSKIFDRAMRGRGYRRLFFEKRRYLTEEFILPIVDPNAIINLPLDSNSWDEWKRVKPLYLWTHDSHEYTVKMINDRVCFRSIPPSYAVILLDVIGLIFKYYVWLHKQRKNEIAEELALHIPQQLFLHKYVMSDLVYDLTNNWLIRTLEDVIDTEDFDSLSNFSAESLINDIQYGRVVSNARTGLTSLWKLVQDIGRNTRPEILFSIPLLLEDQSLNDRMRLLDTRLETPRLRQYEYLQWIRDKDILHLFIKVWKKRSELPKAKTIFRRLDRELGRMMMRRPWNICQNALLKQEIEASVEATADLLL